MVTTLPRHPLTRVRAATPRAGPSARARREARAGLYVHVPFCAVRCRYCDFSSGALSARAVERYLAGIERECVARAPSARDLTFSSVFFGGGTPSALAARAFRRVWRALTGSFAIAPGAEITLEANPESVRPALLEAWAEAGVNRLSFGAQSFVPEELERLGRIHDADRPAAAVELARAHGFANLSLDLMFGFPGHTPERWQETLARALALGTPHLSAYCFIPEPGTPLGDAALAGTAALPEPEVQADLYDALLAATAGTGLGPYETSNFCRPGHEARHNLVYWLRRPYVGIGPSAHGLLPDGEGMGVRYGNHYGLDRWAAALERDLLPESEREIATPSSAASESVMLALRLAGGIRPRDYAPELRAAIARHYAGAFARARAGRRLIARGGGFALPARHRFLADDTLAWIEARAAGGEVDSVAMASVPSSPCPSLPFPVV